MSQDPTGNPYSVPQDLPSNEPTVGMDGQLRLGSQNQRFLSIIVDNIVLYGVNLAFGLVLGGMVSATANNPISESTMMLLSYIISFSIFFLYFAIMEATTGVTLGKLVVGTRVVSADGRPPSIGQVLGRSLCRFIPFEAFSFLGNKGFPIGWHDSIPKTRVIKTR